ncbi:hypothetical protein AGABI2DRAFT_121403 [Agaricus bisporus var. bisporus H97]|uniref:hypothetical protein n=1 Tax=Agaricus bisporus var. bisporus (strain H97 / ATCC MYA-4626 / FGSC 10389) TaxID=936046 RepID=UPI00029F6CD1|nr:hypothetical protein AGABI2DRAFT_121403 [Agaricus bisporus var. bisporus H97]EKV44221.1 hypothetical protein AGABI2DRAFT_121403 [Agaricus bisporus var. bisporus H97]
MSLSDFPSTPTSPRFLGHRHSMYATGRRPLRPSPLAGPAFRIDEPIEEVDEEKNQLSHLPGPSRVLSTPNLATLITPPPRLRHAGPKGVECAQERFSHVSISSPFAKPSKRSLSLIAKRRNSEMVPPLHPLPPLSSPLLQSRSASSVSPRYHYYPTTCDMGNKNEKEPLAPPPVALQRPKSVHGYPTIRHKPIIPIPEQQLDHQCIIAPARTRDPRDNSWFTANTYQVTPKFTRLGLAASGVVLPVSAKKYKKLSYHSSRSSLNTGAPSAGVLRSMDSTSSSSLASPVPSTLDANPKDVSQDSSGVTTPTLTRSYASSLCSDESSIAPSDILLMTSTPVVVARTDSSTTITTIVEGDESGGSLSGLKDLDERESQSQRITAAISSKKNKFARFELLRHRTTKSFNSLYHTSINQQSKDDRCGSNEKRKGSNDEGTARRYNEIKLGLEKFSRSSSSESSSSESLNEADMKRDRVIPMKKSHSMKGLWKSITVNW